jgi:hypothetical protein
MNKIYIILTLFVAIFLLNYKLYCINEYKYEIDDEYKLLLIKNDVVGLNLIFQSKDNLNHILIFAFSTDNNLHLVKTIDLSQIKNAEMKNTEVYAAEYINEILYLSINYSINDGNSDVNYNQIVIFDEEIRTLDFSLPVYDIKMHNNKEGVFIKADTIFVTWDNWNKLEKQVFDYEVDIQKIAYLNTVRNVILFERDNNMNLKILNKLDLLNSSVDFEFKHPIDTALYKEHYKLHSFLYDEEEIAYISYEYFTEDSEVNFEIAKTSDNGNNWEILYNSELTQKFENSSYDVKLFKLSKLVMSGDFILAVNYEQILYSSDKGNTWIEFNHNFLKENNFEVGNNIFPMFVNETPIIFTETNFITLNIDSKSITTNKLNVYPNPVRDRIIVEISADNISNYSNIKLELIHISSGKSYQIDDFDLKINSGRADEIEIDLSTYVKGAYLINIKNGNENICKSIIIE